MSRTALTTIAGVRTSVRGMSAAEDEAVGILQDLIRCESVNDGTGRGKGERQAAEYVAEKLEEVGVHAEIFESAPNRASVVARIPGADPTRDALLIHHHLDVVPAEPKEWTYDPFAAELADGCVWGRGAIDMLDMNAMTLAIPVSFPAAILPGFEPEANVARL